MGKQSKYEKTKGISESISELAKSLYPTFQKDLGSVVMVVVRRSQAGDR